jgi:hypothetical protein
MSARTASGIPKKTGRVQRDGKITPENSLFDLPTLKAANPNNTHGGMPLKKSLELFREYGITGGVYFDLWCHQEDKCAICGHHPGDGWFCTELVVDHCHKAAGNRGRSPTKPLAIRGLLCSACNGRLTDALCTKVIAFHQRKRSSHPMRPDAIGRLDADALPRKLRGPAMGDWLHKAADYLDKFYTYGSPLLRLYPGLVDTGAANGIMTVEEEAIWANLPAPILNGVALVRARQEADAQE